ncbi:MAG TPA: ATP-binding cassette domain-containing protein [Gammaproteobacteria bacterium]|nr:ATP-binding cassette domain-containing protein [Gammaproteobacteria bacterium]
MSQYAIEIKKLTKIYPPKLKAVDELDLAVKEGEIMALLGPNGAGKSTTIRVLSTLSGFDSGQALIAGIDVDKDPQRVRQTIGVVAQQTGVDYFLTGRENLMLQGHLYRMKKADIAARIDELAEHFDLGASLDKPVSAYSGGMTRKLDIATALIHRPRILYLDEPTLGLDIRSRKMLWTLIEDLNQKHGLTILLTTHYLEEADKLSDRVAIINAGRIQIVGTPEELKNGIHGDSVVISFENVGQAEQALAAHLKEAGIARETVFEGNNLHLYVEDGAGSIPVIMENATARQVQVKTLSLARPTLDDVFLKYTGTSMLESGEEETEEWWHKWAGKGGGGNWKKWAGQWEEGDGGEDWQGNEWVDAEGKPKGDWGDDPDWQGNEWVDAEGKPKTDWSEKKKSSEKDKDDQKEEGGWQGNEWVDKEGRQKGDWGNDPDWQGNEWVDAEGKLRTDWSEKKESPEGKAGQKEEGDWQGNEWVDAEGKPRTDWSAGAGKKRRS